MAVRHCDKFIDCPGTDFPVTNYSAEGPEDEPRYYGLTFPRDSGVLDIGCVGTGLSITSQGDANIAALANQALCPSDGPVDPNECGDGDVPNEAQSCTVTSAGSEFHFTLPSGTITGSCQTTSNAQAAALACQDADDDEFRLRLGSIVDECCIDEAFSAMITATGVGMDAHFNSWVITAGALPPGLDLLYEGFGPPSNPLTGTPTDEGSYSFTVKFTRPNGDWVTRNYTICVVKITPTPAGSDATHLPDGDFGEDYLVTLSATACAHAPVSWQVVSGALPTGLSLNEETGEISGTCLADPGDYTFTVRLQTAAT